MYDYLIVGAGLYGSVFAHQATQNGKSCLVIDRRSHLGGNLYCENIAGINVHQYGPHIFHTSDLKMWNFVNSFVSFNRFTNEPLANFDGKLYNLPFNMNTFNQMWGVTTPEEARMKIEEQRQPYTHIQARNLEEMALKMVGKDIYETLIKGYTEKQWGRKATELPSFIIKRLPIRFSYNNNYFSDTYQGVPKGGYNLLINKLLKNCDTCLNVDYNKMKDELRGQARTVVYTGMLDEYFDYCYGELEYRSLRFEHQLLDRENYQGNAVINYTSSKVDHTRIIEHKHFECGCQPQTVITKEYPLAWNRKEEAYYPINDLNNNSLYLKYRTLASQEKNFIFGGRLAEYAYYDMDKIVHNALNRAKEDMSL
ncbi:MAG: UDP-galactopyranose mutase [bacterium]